MRDVFLFHIACRTEFGGKPQHFSKAELVPQTEGKQVIFDAVYEQEFQAPRQSATRDAAHLEETGASVLTDVLEAAI